DALAPRVRKLCRETQEDRGRGRTCCCLLRRIFSGLTHVLSRSPFRTRRISRTGRRDWPSLMSLRYHRGSAGPQLAHWRRRPLYASLTSLLPLFLSSTRLLSRLGLSITSCSSALFSSLSPSP